MQWPLAVAIASNLAGRLNVRARGADATDHATRVDRARTGRSATVLKRRGSTGGLASAAPIVAARSFNSGAISNSSWRAERSRRLPLQLIARVCDLVADTIG